MGYWRSVNAKWVCKRLNPDSECQKDQGGAITGGCSAKSQLAVTKKTEQLNNLALTLWGLVDR